jgi:hypothetical protein
MKALIQEVNGDDYLVFNNCFTDKWIWHNSTVRNSWSNLDKEFKPCPFESFYEDDYHLWHEKHTETGMHTKVEGGHQSYHIIRPNQQVFTPKDKL